MVSAATITNEIAQVKSNMMGLDGDNPVLPELQVILNMLQIQLLVANAGNGATIGASSVGVTTPPGQQSIGANRNEPVQSHTLLNKIAKSGSTPSFVPPANSPLVNLVNSLGIV